MSTYPLDYWQTVPDPFAAVRTGWTERDFDTRTDESNALRLELRPGDVVLDYGCGLGYACKLVAPKVRQYVGIDYSRRMLEIAACRNKAHINAFFMLNDGLTIPDGDGTYDVIFCELVFQHLTRQEQMAIVKEMARVLKPGGRMLLQFPTRFYGDDIGWHEIEMPMLAVAMRMQWRIEAGGEHYWYAYAFK